MGKTPDSAPRAGNSGGLNFWSRGPTVDGGTDTDRRDPAPRLIAPSATARGAAMRLWNSVVARPARRSVSIAVSITIDNWMRLRAGNSTPPSQMPLCPRRRRRADLPSSDEALYSEGANWTKR